MKSPAFSFYPKDYMSDENVLLMSLEQRGAYVDLLCHAWLHGSIPSETPALALICRTTPARMARLWPGIKPCWKEAGPGRLVNGRQERERAGQQARRAQAEEKGKKGAAKRWLDHSPSYAPAKAQPMPGDGFPSARPSASTYPLTDTKQTARQNPLLGDRASRERECLDLVTAVAQKDGIDPVEAFSRSAEWKGKGAVNPAALSDDRLLHTIRDLRRRAGTKADEPSLPTPPTSEQWQAGREAWKKAKADA